jgi:ATP-dependent DNA helicase RecG
MLSLSELETLYLDLESDRVERKPSLTQREEIRKNICAFANDMPAHGKPGVVFVGVEDAGTCAGLAITDELQRTLSDMRSDGNILPQPVLTVQKHTLRGCEVVIVAVRPANSPPVRYKGVTWIRVGPTLRRATPEEEQVLSERRRAVDLPFDSRPVPGATISDLDLALVENEYLPNSVAPDVLAENRRSLAQQLSSLRFATPDGNPVMGALLAFGHDPRRWLPGAYVQFLRIDGGELGDPIRDQKELSGPLREVLVQLDELLRLNISIATDIAADSREIRRPDYPLVALQQLIRNAVMHRSYEATNAPVKLYWFSDRIEIHNPGGLYGQVNEVNFGQGATDYRNPLLAEAMKVLGFVQKFGYGLPTARRELDKNGNPPPEFEFQPNSVLAIVRRV